MLCFLGDVTEDVATTAVFSDNALIMIVNTIAHITEYIQANIQTLKGLDVFPA